AACRPAAERLRVSDWGARVRDGRRSRNAGAPGQGSLGFTGQRPAPIFVVRTARSTSGEHRDIPACAKV
ncbi:unnamed protein product, partial [Urochloa humidicola]